MYARKSMLSTPNKPSLLSYHGRARRSTYWRTTLWIGLVASVTVFISILPFLNELAKGGMDDLEVAVSRSANGLLAAVVVCIVTFFSLLPVNVRRLHDRNMSGWWLLAFWICYAIPFVRIMVWMVQFVLMGCLDGTPGPNSYGPDPKRSVR